MILKRILTHVVLHLHLVLDILPDLLLDGLELGVVILLLLARGLDLLTLAVRGDL